MNRDRRRPAGPRRGPSAEEQAELIYGVQPVLELVESARHRVERIFVARDAGGGLGRVLRTAREAGIPVTHITRQQLGRRVGGRAKHQGIAAQVAAMSYADPEQVVAAAAERSDGLIVMVDRVVDPGNLGAIVRTAAGAGAAGILLSTEGTVGLTPAVAKASAGAVARVPVAREPKPPRRLADLSERGFRTVVLDPRAELSWDRADLTGRLAVVAGGEEKGPRPAVIEACDIRVAIPLAEGMDSLNVGVSLGVLLFEAIRQRIGQRSRP
ncbi:MAG: 23S rRNA (guanosine(2251)-2'-O)-methyltransferase RlmB [bacterium]|nr:23S rRNA (guanosine(2251)-2'-O)-methyltransferase RlmB [bacterium]